MDQEHLRQNIVEESLALHSGEDGQAGLSDTVYRMLRDFIYRQSGIYYADPKKYLFRARVLPLLRQADLKSFEEYYEFLKEKKSGSAELNALFSAITINETSFFRSREQFEAMGALITTMLGENGKRSLRIWSAACSTGEEPYTIAIYLRENIMPLFPDAALSIHASDISRAALGHARKALYGEYAIRNIPPGLLAKYFSLENGKYRLSEEISSMVQFSGINFYDAAELGTEEKFDIVFCCNALIYFDRLSKLRALSNIYQALNSGGYLFVGYSESLHGISRPFRLIHLHKALAYRKE